MTPAEESRLLTLVLKRIESPPSLALQRLGLPIANWLLLVAASVGMFHIAARVGTIVYVVAGVAVVLGVTTGVVVIYRRSVTRWPVLFRFIDVEKVKHRIDELKPNKSQARTRER